jgi:hypothetical protein
MHAVCINLLAFIVLTLNTTSQIIQINKFHEKELKFIPLASAGQTRWGHTQSKMDASSSDVARVW